MNSIGDKIKEYIKKNHMSESDFCEIAGYSQEYLSLVMADQIFPHLEKLERRFKTKFDTEDYIEGEPPISDKMMIGVLEFKDKSQKKEYIYRDEYEIYKVNYDASGKEINRLYFSPDIKIVRYRECK